jgi:hypothetical protein
MTAGQLETPLTSKLAGRHESQPTDWVADFPGEISRSRCEGHLTVDFLYA